jgi:hypothetical protein
VTVAGVGGYYNSDMSDNESSEGGFRRNKKFDPEFVDSTRDRLEIYSVCIFNLLGPLLSIPYFCYSLLMPILDGLRIAYENENMKAQKEEERENKERQKLKDSGKKKFNVWKFY